MGTAFGMLGFAFLVILLALFILLIGIAIGGSLARVEKADEKIENKAYDDFFKGIQAEIGIDKRTMRNRDE